MLFGILSTVHNLTEYNKINLYNGGKTFEIQTTSRTGLTASSREAGHTFTGVRVQLGRASSPVFARVTLAVVDH